MIARVFPVMLSLLLAGCGGKADAPAAIDGNGAAAKAVADVDAAMVEATRADRPTPTAVPAN